MSDRNTRKEDDDDEDSDVDDEEGSSHQKGSDDLLENDEDEEEEDEEEEEGDEKNVEVVPLTAEMIFECLSLLCKTGDGMAHAYARLNAPERGLTDIQLLSSYIYVRYVDISKNRIADLSPLNSMTQLLTLTADSNFLSAVGLEELPYLQRAYFSHNRIENLNGVNHPLLEILNVNFNRILSFSGLDSDKLGRLQTLELRGNKLKNLAGLNLPHLKSLFLAENNINSLEGLHQLENLTLLHLRSNELASLDGFSEQNTDLEYVNLRANKIEKLKELRKLKDLKSLRVLILLENSIDEMESCRMEALVYGPTLHRINKEEVTEEEIDEAKPLRADREEHDDDDEDEEDEQEEEEEDDDEHGSEGKGGKVVEDADEDVGGNSNDASWSEIEPDEDEDT